jgi:hypothetical protein
MDHIKSEDQPVGTQEEHEPTRQDEATVLPGELRGDGGDRAPQDAVMETMETDNGVVLDNVPSDSLSEKRISRTSIEVAIPALSHDKRLDYIRLECDVLDYIIDEVTTSTQSWYNVEFRDGRREFVSFHSYVQAAQS